MADDTAARELQQLRYGRDVPVGVLHLDVAEVGRELRQLPLDVRPAAVPVEEGLGGEPVAQIVKARSTSVAVPFPAGGAPLRRSIPDLLRHLGARVPGAPAGDTAAPRREKKPRLPA